MVRSQVRPWLNEAVWALPLIDKRPIDPSFSVLLRATALGLNDLRFNRVSTAPRRVAFNPEHARQSKRSQGRAGEDHSNE